MTPKKIRRSIVFIIVLVVFDKTEYILLSSLATVAMSMENFIWKSLIVLQLLSRIANKCMIDLLSYQSLEGNEETITGKFISVNPLLMIPSKWWWNHYLKLVRFLQQDVVNVLNTTVSWVEGLFCVKSFLSPATLQLFQPKVGQNYTDTTCIHWIHRLWFGVKDGGIVQENMAGCTLRYCRFVVFSAVQRWPSLGCAKALAD